MSTSQQHMQKILDEKFPADVTDLTKAHFAKCYQSQTPVATWHISLDIECPKCGKDVDLTDVYECYENIEPGQTVKAHSFNCPECNEEFEADTQY